MGNTVQEDRGVLKFVEGDRGLLQEDLRDRECLWKATPKGFKGSV